MGTQSQSQIEVRCVAIADTVVPNYRNGKRAYSCTSQVARMWQAAYDGAAATLTTPLPRGAAVPAGAPVEWRCYHCGDVFTEDRGARLHFGRDEDSIPACQIKAGAEQGLLGALREAEYAAADAQQAVANECTDAAKAYYAQASRHAQALRNAEELGYERGLADGREIATAPKVASDAGAGLHGFVQKIADMVCDELDAHASTELRDAARAVLATDATDGATAGGEARLT